MSLLSVEGLHAWYGPAPVLHGLDLTVDEGEVVVLLGANGAGKTTTLRAVSGTARARGCVRVGAVDLLGRRPHRIARLGVGHVPEGRGTFPDLTVEENLFVAARRRSRRQQVAREVARWYDVFPRLGERRSQAAGSLSGGEQQMLAIARALVPQPRLLLLDEPSAGLAPLVTRSLFSALAELNRELGTAMLLVEQNAASALELASRAYVLEAGRVAVSGAAASIAADDGLRRAYLGY